MGLIKIQCKECSRVVIDYDEYYFSDYLKCRECGGYFNIIDGEEELDYEDCDESEDENELELEDEENEPESDSEEESNDIAIQNGVVLSTNLKQDNIKSKFNPEQTTRFD